MKVLYIISKCHIQVLIIVREMTKTLAIILEYGTDFDFSMPWWEMLYLNQPFLCGARNSGHCNELTFQDYLLEGWLHCTSTFVSRIASRVLSVPHSSKTIWCKSENSAWSRGVANAPYIVMRTLWSLPTHGCGMDFLLYLPCRKWICSLPKQWIVNDDFITVLLASVHTLYINTQ